MSRRREQDGQGGVRKKSSDSGPKIGNRESVRKTEIKMVRSQDKAREKDERTMMGRMESTLKSKVSEMKQQEDGTFSKMISDKATGHVDSTLWNSLKNILFVHLLQKNHCIFKNT